jgi:uncharacterized repeat protein (TIGR01451 family)
MVIEKRHETVAYPTLHTDRKSMDIKRQFPRKGEFIMEIFNTSNLTFHSVHSDGHSVACEADSNTVATQVLTYSVPIVKSSDQHVLEEGEIAYHTVTISNHSLYTLRNIFFQDIMSDGASYVADSLTVNGSPKSDDLKAGFSLPDLAAGKKYTVVYGVQADSPVTESTVTDHAKVSFALCAEECGSVDVVELSNSVETEIVPHGITLLKSVDKTCAVSGTVLRYTTVITNTGSSSKCNLFFTDPIPEGTTFVENSVTIDGDAHHDYRPQDGFALPDLAAGASVTVGFEVTVD